MRFISRQLLKVIEWTESRTDLIAYKFPIGDRAEIMNGSILTVREGQIAVLTKDGQIADIYAPGRHRLDTANMPVLTTLMNWNKGFKNPFKCDVYFINTTLFTGQKWGTANPFPMRDPEFGMIRIRGFGTYNFRVRDPRLLMVALLGALGEFTVANIKEKLRSLITSNISNIIADAKYSAIDLATKLRDFNSLALEKLQPYFNEVGFELSLLVVENISFPEAVERAIDERSSIGVMEGKMASFVAMQQAQAMRDMANNQNAGGGMVGLGMMGGMMNGNSAMNNIQDAPTSAVTQTQVTPPQPQAQPAPVAPVAHTKQQTTEIKTETVTVSKPSAVPAAAVPLIVKNDDQVVKSQETKSCPDCKYMVKATSKFCNECGHKFAMKEEPKCMKCKSDLVPGSKFCNECGHKVKK